MKYPVLPQMLADPFGVMYSACWELCVCDVRRFTVDRVAPTENWRVLDLVTHVCWVIVDVLFAGQLKIAVLRVPKELPPV